MTFEQVVADIQAHLIPGTFLVPAMVGEISRLAARGYPTVYIPKEPW